MADESVKDLVVRLSFEHGDTKSQIASIKNEIKLLDSGFQAAAAQAGGFSSSLNQAAARSQLLRQQIALQEQAVAKYGQAIEAAQQKMQAAKDRQAQYTELLAQAKEKHAALESEIARVTAAMQEQAAATGEDSDEYRALATELEGLQAELKENETAIEGWEKGIERSEKAIVKAEKSIQRLSTEQNKSKAAIGKMKTELEGLNKSVDTHKSRLKSASEALANYSKKAETASKSMERAGKTMSKATAAIVGAGTAAVATAISWESSCADVEKTVSGTAEQLREIEDGLMAMSQEKPIDATTLAEIAANAGQLGIATDNILEFTSVMGDLANTTNLTAEEGASAFSKFANITGMSQENFSRLGSTVVTLGNNLATTEADVVAMATNMASAGTQIGMTEAQIMGMAGALSSLGLEAQAGGTAFSKLFVNMKVAVETGSDELKEFAKIAGMTGKEFQQAFRQDAAGAVTTFIQGLSSGSQSAIVMLDEMGIKETRFRDALLRSANATELFENAMGMANEAWRENSALSQEAAVRYNTTASKMQMLGNRAKAAAIQFGNDLLPVVQDVMGWIEKLVDKFGALDEGQRKQILMWGAFVAAVGPVTTVLGKVTHVTGTVAGALSKLGMAAAESSSGLSGLAGVAGSAGLTGLMIALAAAVGVASAKFLDWATGAKAAREATEGLNDTVRQWKETAAQTIYDTGTSDPLALFGLSAADFQGAVSDSGEWFNSLVATWTDGKAETTEIVKSFAKDFATASDGVREAVAGRKELLENYSALTPEQKKAMEEDLKQLDQWDAEVEALLKKRKNGTLTNEDQARLQEILSARAELEIKYSVDPGDGYDQIITKMQAALERGKNSGNVDSTLLGDTMRALAEGRKAYMEALNQSYDAEYAQISLIEDESSRMAALAALNEEYQQKRARGQEEYSKAVQEAGKDVWENSDQLAEQIANVDKLAEMVGEFNGIEPGAWVDPKQIEALNEFVQGMSEADLAGMLALIEQMKDAGMSDEDLKSLGIDYDDIKGKLEAIRDVAQSVEGLEPVSELIGTALPEEVTRVLVGLDLTQATTDWETFASGGSLTPISAAVEITGDVDVTGLAVTGTPTGTVTVTGELAPVIKTKEGLAYKVADFKVGVNGELDEITLENGKTYEITGYKVGVDGQLQSVTTKSGETYEVTGFSVPVNGELQKTITTKAGVTYEVTSFTVGVDGELREVTTKDGVTYEIAGYSIGVDGTLQTVTTKTGETYEVAGFSVPVNGSLKKTITAEDGVAYEVAGFTVDVDGKLKAVTTKDGVTYEIAGYSIGVDGKLQTVTTEDGKTYAIDGFEVDVNGRLAELVADNKVYDAGAKVTAAATIRLNPLDKQAIVAWEAANAGVEITGPAAKASVKLGADWSKDLKEAYDAGLLQVWGADGAQIEVTPEVLKQITAQDVAMLGEDGTLHIILTPELGSTEGVEAGQALAEDKGPLGGSAFEFMSQSAIEQTRAINGASAALEEYRAEAEAATALDPLAEGVDPSKVMGQLSGITTQLRDLGENDEKISALATDAAQLMAALSSGDLDPAEAAEYAAMLQEIADLVGNADQYLGTGNQVSAGIAQGMREYGWASDATTLAGDLQDAVNSALGVASPATTMKPTGDNVAAGIAEGMTGYSFAAAAAGVSSGIRGAFAGLPGEGRTIGRNFGQGLYDGLKGKLEESLSLAKSYAAKITAAFQNAWEIHSPSRVAKGLTEMFGEGLEQGMRDWPKVDERMLQSDIGSLYGGARQAQQVIRNNNVRNDNAVNMNIERLEVRDQADAEGIAQQIAGLTRRRQRARGC